MVIHDGRDDQTLGRIIALNGRLSTGSYDLPKNAMATLRRLYSEEMAAITSRVITLLHRTCLCEGAREVMWMGEESPSVHALKNVSTHRTAMFDEATVTPSIGCGPFREAQDGLAVLAWLRA